MPQPHDIKNEVKQIQLESVRLNLEQFLKWLVITGNTDEVNHQWKHSNLIEDYIIFLDNELE